MLSRFENNSPKTPHIDDLPEELILEIIHCLRAVCYRRTWLYTVVVSRRWREIITSCAHLWTVIHVSSLEVAKAFLERSKGLPVSIVFFQSGISVKPIVELLSAHRTKIVDIHFVGLQDSFGLLATLGFELENLRVLRLAPATLTVTNFPKAPNLKTLIISSVIHDWVLPVFPNLTHLEISGRGNLSPSIAEISAMLEPYPLLEHLEMTSFGLRHLSPNRVELKRLLYLRLQTSEICGSVFLSSVSLPSCVSFEITFFRDLENPEYETSSFFTRKLHTFEIFQQGFTSLDIQSHNDVFDGFSRDQITLGPSGHTSPKVPKCRINFQSMHYDDLFYTLVPHYPLGQWHITTFRFDYTTDAIYSMSWRSILEDLPELVDFEIVYPALRVDYSAHWQGLFNDLRPSEEKILCPHLENLHLSGVWVDPDEKLLEAVFEALKERTARGSRLETFQIDDWKTFEDEEVEWPDFALTVSEFTLGRPGS